MLVLIFEYQISASFFIICFCFL
uniref:Uncharacterized protein n=1 Tax=Anguilla anguilla TaxID=7936 RepID=A0A0E9PAD5_ANGAN